MRIISNFSDYYDSIQGMGIDKECVYVRKIQEIPLIVKRDYKSFTREVPIGRYNTRCNYQTNHDSNYFIIGFCGEIYPIVQIDLYNKNEGLSYTRYSFFKKTWKKGEIRKLLNEKEDPKERRIFKTVEQEVSDFLHKQYKDWKEIFYTHKVPIFIAGRHMGCGKENCIELNGELKSLQFYKVKDPYTTYQDIYQFISGVLGLNAPKTVDISDSSKIIKHGFDKWTFRKMPQIKK
ncbi:MAG: hypothetical protein WC554_19760 [Clostridia bacterium]